MQFAACGYRLELDLAGLVQEVETEERLAGYPPECVVTMVPADGQVVIRGEAAEVLAELGGFVEFVAELAEHVT